jgi:L-aminopeptidase/D-esterase-like protein
MASTSQSPASGITAVLGIRVGHSTRPERPTGCTVILTPPDTVGAVDQRGGAPGTAETDLLRPENTVSVVHAIVLTGGSAYGLDVRGGVMKFLNEQKVGFPFGGVYVPIVPAAVLFDLPIGGRPEIHPDAACGYDAAKNAKVGAIEEGSIGAGAGATVGKFAGGGRAMKGGIGTADVQMPDGLIVGAIVAVNAAGSVIDRHTGKPIAGARSADGRTIEDPFALLRRGATPPGGLLENTTLAVVATNARLTKAQALKVAQMAQDGVARSIVPSHTANDGDTLFVLATGSLASQSDPDVSRVGALAAEAISDAIERGVQKAKGLPGYPGVQDLR